MPSRYSNRALRNAFGVRQSEDLARQQARSEGEDAYSEESGESEDDSTSDGGKRVTPSGKLEKEPDLVQHTCIGQQEYNPVTISCM